LSWGCGREREGEGLVNQGFIVAIIIFTTYLFPRICFASDFAAEIQKHVNHFYANEHPKPIKLYYKKHNYKKHNWLCKLVVHVMALNGIVAMKASLFYHLRLLLFATG
jgi:hypothetical protein